jgi:hypothetical protein
LTGTARSHTIARVSTRALFLSLFATTAAAVVAACGARSELAVETPHHDAGPDVVVFPDAGPDVADAAETGPDAPFDAPPPICDDAGVTFIYVITQQNNLYSFYPPSGAFTFIGTIDCPAPGGASPFSMAVDRGGTAYVVFGDGELFRVSTANASCETTDFAIGQEEFTTFGMGFSSNMNDPGETLYVAQSPTMSPDSKGLASIDTTTLELTFIAPFSPPLGRTELTGTGDGRLFGFSTGDNNNPSRLAEIDKTSGALLSVTPLDVGGPSSAFAYAFWGNAFYIFTADVGTATTVTRYTPDDGKLLVVATNPDTIVGAGVSTCAPN